MVLYRKEKEKENVIRTFNAWSLTIITHAWVWFIKKFEVRDYLAMSKTEGWECEKCGGGGYGEGFFIFGWRVW